MEEDCAHVVQMPIKCEEASSRLMVPHFDLVVVSTAHEQRLCFVKVYPSYWAIVFFEAIYERAHSVVP